MSEERWNRDGYGETVPVQEFDCVDCGRHIVALCGPPTDKCGACQCIPGWYHNPEIAKAIDPDMSRKPRLH